jgi:ParB family chromosome partitioning protein
MVGGGYLDLLRSGCERKAHDGAFEIFFCTIFSPSQKANTPSIRLEASRPDDIGAFLRGLHVWPQGLPSSTLTSPFMLALRFCHSVMRLQAFSARRLSRQTQNVDCRLFECGRFPLWRFVFRFTHAALASFWASRSYGIERPFLNSEKAEATVSEQARPGRGKAWLSVHATGGLRMRNWREEKFGGSLGDRPKGKERALSGLSWRNTMSTPETISLSQSRDIPFNKLVLSDRNVRRILTGLSIEELAEDIAQRSLLQSLSVRPIAGREGFYEVQAGGRRFRALERLVAQKRLAVDAPIPCIVREDGILEEDSLAENVQRQNLHPLDQFRAFQALSDQGLGIDDIAARFFVTPQIVKQRLKLTSVSPRLLDIYAADGMKLEQLMAFTVSDDPARQEQVWDAVSQGYNKSAHQIRRLLTENAVETDDKCVRFVGIEAYEAAGGGVLRDLFSEDGDGWVQDIGLLDRLVSEKIALEAEAIKAEGWKWLQIAVDFPYGHKQGLCRIEGEEEPLSAEEEACRAALTDEKEEIERQYFQDDGEEIPDDVERRLIRIEEMLEEIDDRPLRYDPAAIAHAGAFVSIDEDGCLKVERGFVRPEDDKADPDAADGEDEADVPDRSCCMVLSGGQISSPDAEENEEDGLKPLSDRLVMELTAHRTLALREVLAHEPDTAFLAVLHALALQTFYRFAMESCLEITAKSAGFSVQGPDLKDCVAAKAIEARHAVWEKRLPKDENDLWDALRSLDADSRNALFAHCAALTINAIQEPWNRAPGRKRHADQIAGVLALDMAATGWQPTVANYLGRVSKARILDAVTESKGTAAAEWIGICARPTWRSRPNACWPEPGGCRSLCARQASNPWLLRRRLNRQNQRKTPIWRRRSRRTLCPPF